jgi:hypothetical protein
MAVKMAKSSVGECFIIACSVHSFGRRTNGKYTGDIERYLRRHFSTSSGDRTSLIRGKMLTFEDRA